jgi:molecular chaperone HtpG
MPLINAGHTLEAELIERLRDLPRDVRIERFDPSDLATRFDPLDATAMLDLRPFMSAAQRVLDRLGCEVIVRSFAPADLSALYLIDREAAFGRELRRTKDKADAIWSDVLSALDSGVADVRPQLVLNIRSPLVRRITALADPDLIGLAVEALYGQALLLGYHPIQPADAALLNRSFLGLLDRAVPPAATGEAS